MPNKISTSLDYAFPGPIPPACFTTHEYMGPTPYASPPPIKAPWGVALECPVAMFWPPGMALGQNKLTTTVVHQNAAVVQGGHDCGTAIPHLQLAPGPLNALTPLHILFSSRKVNFSSTKALSQGAPTACATLLSWPPAPMMTCMDQISLPVGDSFTSHANTVIITMSWQDIVLGWVSIAASVVMDYLFAKKDGHMKRSAFGKTEELARDVFARELRKKVRDKFVGAGSMDKWLAKNGIGLATGALRMLMTDGSASMKISVGSPFLGAEASYLTRDSAGNYGEGLGANLGPLSGSVSAKDGDSPEWEGTFNRFTGSDKVSSGQDGVSRSRHSTGETWGEPL